MHPTQLSAQVVPCPRTTQTTPTQTTPLHELTAQLLHCRVHPHPQEHQAEREGGLKGRSGDAAGERREAAAAATRRQSVQHPAPGVAQDQLPADRGAEEPLCDRGGRWECLGKDHRVRHYREESVQQTCRRHLAGLILQVSQCGREEIGC